MNITIQKTNDTALAILEGRYDTAAANEVQPVIDELVALAQEGKDISMNFSLTDVITSAGLRQLLQVCKAAGEKKVALTGLSDYELQVLHLSGFEKLFNIK